MVKKLKVIVNLRGHVDVGKDFHDEGIVRMGKEAVGVWQEYFEEFLDGGDEGVEEVHGERERFDNKGSGLLDEDISREGVVWALCKLKVKATAAWEGWDYCRNDE